MKPLKNLLVLAAFVSLFACNSGDRSGSESTQKITFGLPEDLGMITDSLHQIDTLFQHYVDKRWMPGATALIARNGKVIYETAIGFRDLESEISLTIEDIFRLASMSKPVIAMAVMQLLEQGIIQLTDPLSRFIPEFSGPQVLTSFNAADTTWEERPASREITIHDLLTHTSGISYGFMDPTMAAIYGTKQIPEMATPLDFSLQQKMAALGTLPLAHDPGEGHSYGLSSDVLGRVIEIVSGLSLAEYLTREITTPLGMNSTHFFLPDNLHSKLTSAYMAIADSTIIPIGELGGALYHPDYPKAGAGSYYSGGSGLCGSIRDYYLFCQAMLDGGRGSTVRILNDTTVTMMLSDQLGDIPYWPGKAIGYGFEILTEPNELMDQLPGRYSWFGAFQTFFYVDPERDLVAIMMSQVMFSPLVFEIYAEFEKRVNSSVKK
jgi:CubicO group peptidase (beta-lactamase class C family)